MIERRIERLKTVSQKEKKKQNRGSDEEKEKETPIGLKNALRDKACQRGEKNRRQRTIETDMPITRLFGIVDIGDRAGMKTRKRPIKAHKKGAQRGNKDEERIIIRRILDSAFSIYPRRKIDSEEAQKKKRSEKGKKKETHGLKVLGVVGNKMGTDEYSQSRKEGR